MAKKLKTRDPDVLCFSRTIESAGRAQHRLEHNDGHGYVVILPHTCGFKIIKLVEAQ